MRNWAAELRPASFRGVRFYVEADTFDDARVIARHTYPGGERYYLEDMGTDVPAFNVTAYLLGDEADAQSVALARACKQPGPGRLVLPITAGRLCRVENFSRVHEKDRRGYIAFGFTAIPEAADFGAVLGLGDIRAILTGALALAFPALGAVYRSLDDLTPVAVALYSLGSLVVSDELDMARLTDLTLGTGVRDSETFFAGGLSAARIIGESIVTPQQFDSIKPQRFETANAAALHVLFDAVISATAAPAVSWISRPQARAARQVVQAKGEAALTVVSALGPSQVALYSALSRLTETAVRLVSDRAADAVPVVRIETGISLPSTVIAYQAYGDAKRAQGLVEIARAATPMLMPSAFEALES